MNNPNEQLNEQESESLFGQAEPEIEFEMNAGFASRSITGGKGPGVVSEGESE
ncbi:hypothetical protein H7849_26165 [Alloacidobacterium dinghuense]|uniref:Uncharacterized protein n=1 Tax=Alloacidobacterium dinghuense TaxID=2763107 RepID=A0A7G8BIP8_9BACT|nr:hypothetical protein [Alloacidobacterium dinghuense]QNI32418.1 hypothetical protein H7849_26165 [Alloacidobacterium dinghuense]